MKGSGTAGGEPQNVDSEVLASYEQKIVNYESQVSQLKLKLADTTLDAKQMVKADVPVSARAATGKYADLSINKDVDEPLTEQELNETRIRPSPEKPKQAPKTPRVQSKP